jgi:hypothetical protein
MRLPWVLFTSAGPSSNLTLSDRCKLIQSKDTADHDKTRLTASNNFLKDGKISRDYKALQSSNHPILKTDFSQLATWMVNCIANEIVPDDSAMI